MNQEKIGRFIKKIRIEKKMTQQDLAEKIGVTDRAISKWENGRGTPDISLLIPLSMALEISVLELLNGEKIVDENNVVVDLIKHKDGKIKVWKYLFIGIINVILLLIMIVLFFGFIFPFGYENSSTKGIMRVLSASMEPTIEVGSGIIYDKIMIDEVKKDDLVVYNYMNEEGQFLAGVKVIHRVIQVINGDNGDILLVTKGDNNTENDMMYVSEKNFIGVYNRNVSWLTNLFLEEELNEDIWLFILLIVGGLGIICFDVGQIRIIYNKKYFIYY